MLRIQLVDERVHLPLLCVPRIRDRLVRLTRLGSVASSVHLLLHFPPISPSPNLARTSSDVGTDLVEGPPEPLWHTPHRRQRQRRESRRDEVIGQSTLDNLDHPAREPLGGERGREELALLLLHRVAHLRRDLGGTDDGGAHSRSVVAVHELGGEHFVEREGGRFRARVFGELTAGERRSLG